MAALEAIRKEYTYVGILHDKDTWTEEDEQKNPDHKAGELKKPHYHLILKFTQARWNSALATELGIGENYLERCRNFENAAVYLVHDGLDEKYQYEVECLEGSLVPAVKKLLAGKDENSRILELLDLIRGMGFIEWDDLWRVISKNHMYGDARRMGNHLTNLVHEHNYKWCQEFEDPPRNKQFDDFCKFTSDKGLDELPPL